MKFGASPQRTPSAPSAVGVTMWRAGLWLLVSLWVGAALSASGMQRCGDDVDGHGPAVPCACGDVLVSSRTLGSEDPVTTTVCTGSGLLVAAPGAVTLALGGQTITGSGQGIGVLVLRGTLTLEGGGQIEGFETGVMARGAHALSSVMNVRLSANRLDGLFVEGDGYSIQGSAAEGNGRDGFALGGSTYALDGNRATANGRYGFSLWGMGAHAGGGLGNEADGNGMTGFLLRGMWHQVLDVNAAANHGDGFFGTGMHLLLSGIHTDRNLRSGLRAMGMAIAIGDSTASGNRGFGVWVMGPDVDDRGGNRGTDNAGVEGFATTPSVMMGEMMPALVQCRIGMMTPCK